MLSYSTLFSRVLNKINDPKELSLDESDLLEIYTERLHSVVGKPRVRRLFSSISLDDEIQEMTFTLIPFKVSRCSLNSFSSFQQLKGFSMLITKHGWQSIVF